MKTMVRISFAVIIFLVILNSHAVFSGRKEPGADGSREGTTSGGGWSEGAEEMVIEQKINNRVHINQIGYRPLDRKIAVINGHSGQFQVIRIQKEGVQAVFTGNTTAKPVRDPSSGDKVYYADFSRVTETGEYFLSVPGFGRSFSFRIGPRVYREVKNSLLKVMYYQRCGVALEPEHAGVWSHEACHLEDAYLYKEPQTHRDTTGGWHDAGDYGKYTAPVVVTLADLLLAYELFPNAFRELLKIPESGNGIPDIVNESRFALDWLLKMQDPETGGVHHKVSTKRFPGFIMPEADKGTRYITGISPTATGGFAAIMAVASRVYSDLDREFAGQALAAAERAWQWLVNNPGAPNYKNPPGMQTGEYGDWNNLDERYWAAVELYRATGREVYHKHILNNYRANIDLTALGWQSVGGFGTVSYLLMEDRLRDDKIHAYLKDRILNHARGLVKRAGNDGYRISLAAGEYYWGSNSLVMRRGMILIIAGLLEPDEKYMQAAQDHLHYLFGRNALSKCYLTGFGGNPVLYPHHRPSGAGGAIEPVPGMVAGGPNSGRQDPTAKAGLPKNIPPARAYLDHQGSWSTNEITTYWNSPAVFVTAFFESRGEE